MRVRTMLALAEHDGVNLDAVAFIADRVEHNLGMLDSAEPARRTELERLAAEDFAEVAAAFKRLRRTVERGGEA